MSVSENGRTSRGAGYSGVKLYLNLEQIERIDFFNELYYYQAPCSKPPGEFIIFTNKNVELKFKISLNY
jgi:hypothetical protein